MMQESRCSGRSCQHSRPQNHPSGPFPTVPTLLDLRLPHLRFPHLLGATSLQTPHMRLQWLWARQQLRHLQTRVAIQKVMNDDDGSDAAEDAAEEGKMYGTKSDIVLLWRRSPSGEACSTRAWYGWYVGGASQHRIVSSASLNVELN